jgi:mRNA interferase MazF
MPIVKGDIILVPFPFTDLSENKLRPAVVLWVDDQDVTLCFISSQAIDRITKNEFVILTSDLEFTKTGLKSSSKVRVARIATLERSLLKRRLGQLSTQHLQQLDQCLVKAFQINVYKFTQLTRAEVDAMLGVTLQETRVYQEAKAEGKLEGKAEGKLEGKAEGKLEGKTEGKLEMLLMLLSRNLGSLPASLTEQIEVLPIEQLESLCTAAFDFQSLSDLTAWLSN